MTANLSYISPFFEFARQIGAATLGNPGTQIGGLF
ncbi:hypothetical protein BVI1335_1230007 [Burkholderia vietnamiensis]|nr:hypothetical protein BVI1335_1230007 [Burkholderia vietnamiensis]